MPQDVSTMSEVEAAKVVAQERTALNKRTEGRDMLAESRRLTEAAHELIPRLPVNDRMRAYFEELHDLARTVAMLDPEEAKALLAGNGKVRIDVGCVGFVTHRVAHRCRAERGCQTGQL